MTKLQGGGGRPRRPATVAVRRGDGVRTCGGPSLQRWCAAVAVFFVARNGLVDDAYITLSYVRNVAEHLHWGMIPRRGVQHRDVHSH